MKNIRWMAWMICVVLVSVSILPILSEKAAADPPVNLGIWVTAYPSSWVSRSQFYGYDGTEPPVVKASGTAGGACEINDFGYTQSVYDSIEWWQVSTRGFTNESYRGPIPGVIPPVNGTWGYNVDIVESGYYDSAMGDQTIFSNGTIIAVWLVIVFINPGTINTNTFDLELSTNGGAGFTYGGLGTADFETVANIPAYFCNVTTWRTWTPTMLRSNDTIVRSELHPSFGSTYNIDYLGLYYAWYAPDHWIPAPPNEAVPGWGNPTPDVEHPVWTLPPFGGTWLVDILAGSMAMIGFIGMIAYPAAAIKGHKKGNDPGGSVANFFILELLFIGMLYVGLTMANLT